MMSWDISPYRRELSHDLSLTYACVYPMPGWGPGYHLISRRGGGGVWHDARVCFGLQLVAPISPSPHTAFPSIGGGAHRLLTTPCSLAYLSLSTSLFFPLVGCANGAPVVSWGGEGGSNRTQSLCAPGNRLDTHSSSTSPSHPFALPLAPAVTPLCPCLRRVYPQPCQHQRFVSLGPHLPHRPGPNLTAPLPMCNK